MFTSTFWSLSETFVRRRLFNSSSSSCYSSDVTWQEIGHMCEVPAESRKRYTSRRRDGILGTGMRAATYWATHMTDLLTRRITTVVTTRRTTKQASSDEGLWFVNVNIIGWRQLHLHTKLCSIYTWRLQITNSSAKELHTLRWNL